MKYAALLLAVACLASAAVPSWAWRPMADDGDKIRAMSFNIRFATESDGEHAWRHRAALAASVIRFHQPDIVGLQEALHSQLEDLKGLLPGYEWVGVGRDDGRLGGEFSAILYRADRLDVVEGETFWLSESPSVPGSKSWDTAITRVVTWALFEVRATGTRFYHFNTHFDHIGQEARLQSARLIVDRIRQREQALPVIVTGDFNARPDSPPYAVMAEALHDAREITRTPPHGPEGTFSSFVATRDSMPRIDYIFVTEEVPVTRFATLAEHWDGKHASDHLPVLADVVIP